MVIFVWHMMSSFRFLIVALVLSRLTVQSSLPCKVLVVGSGPAGLLASHCLLSRGNKYGVRIIESREDPRKTEVGSRAYSLGLNIRGQSAIKHFDRDDRSRGLWAKIFSRGVESDAFFLHIGGRKFAIRKPASKEDAGKSGASNKVPPTLLIARNKLSASMLDVLENRYGASKKLTVEFNSKLQNVDLNARTATVNGRVGPYDLIIGSDGVQSAVREALIMQRGPTGTSTGGNVASELDNEKPFVSEETILPGQFKVMQQKFPDALESYAVHAMENGKAGYGLFLIPATDNNTWYVNAIVTICSITYV
jgi:2-polyprenyl-6-methoxyphenol hydroxylase-like FAD-dependent oxidoreductase